MRHLENAFKFTFKNFLLTLPFLISVAIPAIITGVGSLGLVANSTIFIKDFREMMEDLTYGSSTFDYSRFIESLNLGPFVASLAISGLISLVLTIIIKPATYGLINLHYETGNAKLSDISGCMSKYIGRFVLFGLLYIAISIGLSIVFFILIFIGGLVSAASTALGVILIILFVLAFIVGLVALTIYMKLWFPAVCVEDSDIIQGLKNSFRAVQGSFWPILGITILVTLCGSIASAIIGGILSWVPILGSMVGPVIVGLADFILIVYYFDIYREKTGRHNFSEPPQQFNGFQDGNIQ